MRLLFASILLAATSSVVFAQHGNHGSHNLNPSPPASPYAEFRTRTVKALSTQQIDDLRSGKGMGLALAAELNSYPGPMHVLELADELRLNVTQRQTIEALIVTMRRDALAAADALITAETELDRLFASGQANETSLVNQMREISHAQGNVRIIHLRTHLPTRAVLTAEQIALYARLRGYAAN